MIINCLWCKTKYEGNQKTELEHLMSCQTQLTWPIAEIRDEDGKLFLEHPSMPGILFERIARIV